MRPAAYKRIIICCDGTWQSSVSNITNIPSNVTRLARYLAKSGLDDDGKECQQLVYYHAGIGTSGSAFDAFRDGSTGSGFVGNVIEAYNFIVLNYHPGDRIFCMGFSRGAYTARAVAGLVTDIGIIEPRDMQDFPELYHLYQAHNDCHMFRKSKAWREWIEGKRRAHPNPRTVPAAWREAGMEMSLEWEKRPHAAAPESSRWVEAVAVFDTVGSLGIPKIDGLAGVIANPVIRILGKLSMSVEDAGFHNVGLSPYIKHAYHALALDEHRKPFSPTLWHMLDEIDMSPMSRVPSSQLKKRWQDLQKNGKATETQLDETWEALVDAEMHEELGDHRPKLLQVWFPGVHINIGGGNDDIITERKGDFEQIAMITLSWMAEQLRNHLSFEPNFRSLLVSDRFQLLKPALEDLTQNHKDHWLSQKVHDLITREKNQTDPWNDGNKTKSLLAAGNILNAWATGPIVDSFEGLEAVGSLTRTPGQYEGEIQGKFMLYRLGATNEQIHPTVKYRMDCPESNYEPEALKHFQRQIRKVNGKVSYEWVKGGIRIPEYKIQPETPTANTASGSLANLDQFERSCMLDPSAQAYVGRLDKEYGFDSRATRALDEEKRPPTLQPPQAVIQPNHFVRVG